MFTDRVPSGNAGKRLFRYLETRNLDTAPMKPPRPIYIICSMVKNKYIRMKIKGRR
jgi:hypothetical protein